MKNFNPFLYFITDSTGYDEAEFLHRTEEALKGGVTLIQLREKNKTTREYISLAEKVHTLTKKYNVPLIIDDRADVAAEVDAEGVHVGGEDISPKTARKILGENKIVGVTAKTVAAARNARKAGADYVGVGAIYPTTTKVKTVLTSVETLKDICNAVPISVCAIGGLNKENLGILRGIPISGICAVSAIMHAKNPRLAATEMKKRAEEVILCKE